MTVTVHTTLRRSGALDLIRKAFVLGLAMVAFLALPAQNEIENIIVERYYVSDANDATDTIGGGLDQGSSTYRVFVDLCTECALRAIYGDENHPLIISSTALFFNHQDRGKIYGHNISNGALDEGTTALDSWLSMGSASNQKYGVLKTDDTDGSIVGGANNDGGSEEVPGGLLVHQDPLAGIPLTDSDGLVPLNGGSSLPPNFNIIGDDPGLVFGDTTVGSTFNSANVRIGCSLPGVQGPTGENQILIAQLTTVGELSFKLNLEVQRPDGSVVRFVATDSLLQEGEVANGLLNYPPTCGCTDPNFLEYDPAAGCDDGSCATAIIFGCLDTLACNYDPDANWNINELCCYGPGNCNGLEITLVCPTVGMYDSRSEEELILLFPNPTNGPTSLRFDQNVAGDYTISLFDSIGQLVRTQNGSTHGHGSMTLIDLGDLNSGSYHLVVHFNEAIHHRTVNKL